MRLMRVIPMVLLLVLAVALLWLLSDRGQSQPTPEEQPARFPATQPLRFGVIPERDIVAQRKRYRVVADYLAKQLNRPVELATLNTYQAILSEMAEKRVDGAFLGSLIAVLAVDRLGAQIVVKPEMTDGRTTYRGVVFTLENSPVKDWKDLTGRSIAMVRTTTGGNLYPMVQLKAHGLLDAADAPRIVWCGTHDEAIEAVMNRKVDAAAVKDLRLEDYLAENPSLRVRRLGSSGPVPNNALVLRADVDPAIAQATADALLKMHQTAEGRAALKAFGASRFVPCEAREYHVIYDIVAAIGPDWSRLGIDGPPPAALPSTTRSSRD